METFGNGVLQHKFVTSFLTMFHKNGIFSILIRADSRTIKEAKLCIFLLTLLNVCSKCFLAMLFPYSKQKIVSNNIFDENVILENWEYLLLPPLRTLITLNQATKHTKEGRLPRQVFSNYENSESNMVK